MNNKKPPFDNANARKCFASAFNYEGFNQVILKGYVDRMFGLGYGFHAAQGGNEVTQAMAAVTPGWQ